jgi:SOS-response transcriptional repressor LexA
MDELGMKAAPLAREAGLNISFVRDILRGKTKVPKADNLKKLATALQTTPEALLSGERSPHEAVENPTKLPDGPLPYAGTVAAGDWLSDDDFNQDVADNTVPASIPRHPGYSRLPQMAWRVRGDSMNEVGIFDGQWIVGASYADYVDRIGELTNGSFVVVERTRAQGSERELTVKEVQFARRGMRLVPRSTNKRHREFFIDLDEDADPDRETVRILAVVLWAGIDLDPRAR